MKRNTEILNLRSIQCVKGMNLTRSFKKKIIICCKKVMRIFRVRRIRI